MEHMTNNPNHAEEMELLLRDYFAMVAEVAAYTAMQNDLRDRIEKHVAEHGAIKVPHVGTALITPASKSHKYNTKMIDELLVQCIADGDIGTAQSLTDAREESVRKESLRITASK
jgi:hypothetical protein